MDIEKMLATLAPEFREVLILRDLQGFTYDEIAQGKLNIPAPERWNRQHSPRTTFPIRQRFQEYGGTEAKPPVTIREKRP